MGNEPPVDPKVDEEFPITIELSGLEANKAEVRITPKGVADSYIFRIEQGTPQQATLQRKVERVLPVTIELSEIRKNKAVVKITPKDAIRPHTYCLKLSKPQKKTLVWKNRVSAKKIYAIGIIGWALHWIVIFCSEVISGVYVFMKVPFWCAYVFPSIFICGVALSANLWLWKEERVFGDYQTEVRIIETVERNTGMLIVAISVILVLATRLVPNILTTLPHAFIWYEVFALIWASCGVLPLYWVPHTDVKNLVRLRHLKTIPFFYSIFFFMTGVIALLTTILFS